MSVDALNEKAEKWSAFVKYLDYNGWNVKDAFDSYRKLNAVQTEINTYHSRRVTVIDYRKTAHFTIELIDKIIDGSYFKEKSDR